MTDTPVRYTATTTIFAFVTQAAWRIPIETVSSSQAAILQQLGLEASTLGPAHQHPQHHLGPVLRVGAAGAGVDLADRVALVVLAAEQRAQLELVEVACQPRSKKIELPRLWS